MNLKKLSAATLLSSLTLSACAKVPPGHEKEWAELDRISEEAGLPAFNSGIKIVPRSQLGLPAEVLEEGSAELKQQAEIGYVEKEVPYVSTLMDMAKMAPVYIKQYASNVNEESTHMRNDPKDLKLAFKFKGIKTNRLLLARGGITPLGSAPMGSFDKDDGGWSGVIQFFSVSNLGVCSYSVMNVKASGTSAQLAMEDVTYAIHDKATLTHTDGSKNSGFLYKVEWFDDENFHELECANKDYSSKIKQSVISLAKQIDE
jgi:hypothetical protein